MNIKSIRLSLDLSQAKFANKFGIPLSTLAQWEQGRRKPPEYVLKMIYIIIKMDRMLQQYFPNYDCVACDPEGICSVECAPCGVYTCIRDEDFQALDDQEGIK